MVPSKCVCVCECNLEIKFQSPRSRCFNALSGGDLTCYSVKDLSSSAGCHSWEKVSLQHHQIPQISHDTFKTCPPLIPSQIHQIHKEVLPEFQWTRFSYNQKTEGGDGIWTCSPGFQDNYRLNKKNSIFVMWFSIVTLFVLCNSLFYIIASTCSV